MALVARLAWEVLAWGLWGRWWDREAGALFLPQAQAGRDALLFVLISRMAEFTKIFEHVRDVILYGDAHLRIWEGLAQEINRDNGLVGHTAPTFFGLTLEAHLDRALLNAAKTFDGQRDALSLRKVLNCASAKKKTLGTKEAKRLVDFFPEAER